MIEEKLRNQKEEETPVEEEGKVKEPEEEEGGTE